MNSIDLLNKNIRRNIEMFCKQKKLTESELAEKTNIDESDLKSPTKKLSINSLMMICKVLDIELSDLLKGED